MVVSEQDLDELLYLIDGWAFYPDVLLTPDDFASGSPKRYMVYTNIGDHTRFDTPGEPDTPYGPGTYVLHLLLPEQTAVYGLELPEIFSAYRLFINGKNVLSVGDPDPDTGAVDSVCSRLFDLWRSPVCFYFTSFSYVLLTGSLLMDTVGGDCSYLCQCLSGGSSREQ